MKNDHANETRAEHGNETAPKDAGVAQGDTKTTEQANAPDSK